MMTGLGNRLLPTARLDPPASASYLHLAQARGRTAVNPGFHQWSQLLTRNQVSWKNLVSMGHVSSRSLGRQAPLGHGLNADG